MTSALTHLFYVISTSLLVPVELCLILALLMALRLLGVVARETLLRRRERPRRRELEARLERREYEELALFLRDSSREGRAQPATSPLAALAECVECACDEALVEKRASEYENGARATIERAERLAKVAPALGLMGTLIPLGPALLGLAQGDMETLASNLVVAFSTTVVGLAGALVASFCASVYRRWSRSDFVLMNFALDRLADAPHKTETPS